MVRVRNILLSNIYISGIVGTRIYVGFYATYIKKVHPLITISFQMAETDPSISNIEESLINIDIWGDTNVQEIFDIYDKKVSGVSYGVLNLLHGKVFDNDDFSLWFWETGDKMVIYDDDVGKYKLHSVFKMKGIRK